MFQFTKTRFSAAPSSFMEVAPGVTVDQEGVPLVAVMIGGKTYCQPCSATANEEFVGFSWSRSNQIARKTTVLKATVPSSAPYTVALPAAPIVGQVRAEISGSALTIQSGTPTTPASGEVGYSGTTAYFNVAQAGATVTIFMAYVPSYTEAVAALGNAPVGGVPSATVGVVGLFKSGDCYTDMYNSSVDWSTASAPALPVVRLGAGGLLTIGGTGTILTPNLSILQIPSVSSGGWLGVRVKGL